MPASRLDDPIVATFVVIPLLLAAALVWATHDAWRRAGDGVGAARRAATITGAATAAWMAITWSAAAGGLLHDWTRVPPPFSLLLLGALAVSLTLSFGPIGTRLAQQTPIWVLVAVQGFRLPLEIAMHGLATRGIMPIQMSYSGRNFDILTGAAALVVALLVRSGHGGRRLVGIWNAVGLALLVNVVTVALLSTPLVRLFGDDQVVTFVTYTPFVWLPAVMVVAALAGHLVIVRALRVHAAKQV